MKADHAGQVNTRRQKALLRLQEQLKSGVNETLSENDVIRIKKEVTTLQSKIVSGDSALSYKPKKYRGVR